MSSASLTTYDARQVAEAPRMTVGELMHRLDAGEPLTLLDLRSAAAWGAGRDKLPGAVRVDPRDFDDVVHVWPRDRPIITYCT